MRIGHLAALVLAAVACAWFIVGIRQAHDINAATNLVANGKLTDAAARRADSLLDSADVLYPGTEVQQLRGEVDLERGKRLRAQRIFLQVTRQEPSNVQGWLLLANAGMTPQMINFALAHVATLSPKVPSGH